MSKERTLSLEQVIAYLETPNPRNDSDILKILLTAVTNNNNLSEIAEMFKQALSQELASQT